MIQYKLIKNSTVLGGLIAVFCEQSWSIRGSESSKEIVIGPYTQM